MRNSKLERALYGPSLMEITLGLLMSVALGAVLAIVFLILKPVEVVKDMPKEDARKSGMVYYIAGSTDYAKAKQWMRKRQMLLEGTPGEIAFTEDDLNAWFSESAAGKDAAAAAAAAKPAPAKPAAKPAPGKAAAEPAPGEVASEEILIPSVLNFRIRDSALQVGLPTTLNLLGYQFPVVAQMSGGFQKKDEMYFYTPDVVMIGSFPLHRFPGATEYLMERALASSALPMDLFAAWKKVSNAVVDGKTLRLTLR